MPQGQPDGRRPPAAGFATWSAAQRGRWALWSPVVLGAGALVYLLLRSEPPGWTGIAAFAAALLCFAAARLPGLQIPLVGLGLLALGFAAAMLRADLVAAPVLQRPTAAVALTGEVRDAFGHRDGRARVIFAPDAVPGLTPDATPRLVRITLRKADAMPRPGERLSLRARLTPLTSPVTPGGYDFARAAWFQGIGGYGYVLAAPLPLAGGPEGEGAGGFDIAVAALRHDAAARIHAALPGSTGAIAAALMVGDRSQIAAKDDEAMRDSSLAHVLSISGLHMSIVGLGVFGLVRFFGALVPAIALRFHVKKWAAAAALIAAGFYLLLSGESVPAQRSFIMIGLVFVAMMLDRAAFTLRIVAISAFAVLILAPESVVDPSFQMSFAAVTGLVAAFEAFEDWQRRRGRPLVMRDSWTGRAAYALLVAMLASTVAGLATAPYAAFHFNRVAAYGVLANIAAMPVIAFVIMPFAMAALVMMPLGLEAPFLAVAGWGIDAMLWIAHRTADLPGAAGHVASWPDSALGLVTLGGLWLALFRGRWRLLGLGGVAAAAVIAMLTPPPDMLIDRNAANVAVREADGGLALLSGRRGRFAATEWLERDGDDRAVKDSARAGREGVWSCAEGVCSAAIRGRTIGYLERKGSARAACARGFDVLVAARAIDPCGGGLTISAAETARQGAMALWFEESGAIRVETVRDRTGERPWTVWPAQ